MPNTLNKRANDLATYLNENSLFEEQLSHLDVLDALASLGFELTDDSGAHSTSAYYSAVEADLKRPVRRGDSQTDGPGGAPEDDWVESPSVEGFWVKTKPQHRMDPRQATRAKQTSVGGLLRLDVQ